MIRLLVYNYTNRTMFNNSETCIILFLIIIILLLLVGLSVCCIYYNFNKKNINNNWIGSYFKTIYKMQKAHFKGLNNLKKGIMKLNRKNIHNLNEHKYNEFNNFMKKYKEDMNNDFEKIKRKIDAYIINNLQKLYETTLHSMEKPFESNATNNNYEKE